jgi:hypothetical protein
MNFCFIKKHTKKLKAVKVAFSFFGVEGYFINFYQGKSFLQHREFQHFSRTCEKNMIRCIATPVPNRSERRRKRRVGMPAFSGLGFIVMNVIRNERSVERANVIYILNVF